MPLGQYGARLGKPRSGDRSEGRHISRVPGVQAGESIEGGEHRATVATVRPRMMGPLGDLLAGRNVVVIALLRAGPRSEGGAAGGLGLAGRRGAHCRWTVMPRATLPPPVTHRGCLMYWTK
eukprot:jgi/Tetstr1/435128/TSEL_024096.t1